MRLGRLAATIAACAIATPIAAALGAVAAPNLTISDNLHGDPTAVSVDAANQAPQEENPTSAVLQAARGYHLDLRALTATCTPDQAKSFACPAAARIGGGVIDGHASGPLIPSNGRFDFEATVDAFLAPPLQPGDVAGVVLEVTEPQTGSRGTIAGRVVNVDNGPFGLAVRFDDLNTAQPQVPPATQVYIDHVHLDAEAHRTVTRMITKVRTVKRHHKRKRIRRRIRTNVTYGLIVNPPACSSDWPWEMTVDYPSGPRTIDGAITCR